MCSVQATMGHDHPSHIYTNAHYLPNFPITTQPCFCVTSCHSSLSRLNVHKTFRLVRDDPKLLEDGGGIPKSQGRGWRFDSRLWSLLSIRQKLVRWSIASCALVLVSRPSVSTTTTTTTSKVGAWEGETGKVRMKYLITIIEPKRGCHFKLN